MKKKLLAWCLACCLVWGGSTAAWAQGAAFPDLQGCAQWKQEAAEWAGNMGYLVGDEQGRFRPDESVTRAMFVTVLYRMAGETLPESSVRQDIFGDVSRHSYYWDPALWAGITGIVTGVPDSAGGNLFRPDGFLTREQAAAMLYRWAQVQGGASVDRFDTLYQFEDRKTVSPWAREAMEWAVGVQVLQGTRSPRDSKKGELCPWATVTRVEAAAMVRRLAEEIEFQNVPEPDPFQEPGRYRSACGGGERTLGELMDESTLVVAGTVNQVSDCFLYRSYRTFSIFRDFTLSPRETLRGAEALEPVKIRVEGGIVGNWGVDVTAEPSLEAGKEYLLFLAPWGERGGPYRVLGYLGAYERTGEGDIYRNANGEEVPLSVIRQKLELFNKIEPVW